MWVAVMVGGKLGEAAHHVFLNLVFLSPHPDFQTTVNFSFLFSLLQDDI